jgi:hypothetical protein
MCSGDSVLGKSAFWRRAWGCSSCAGCATIHAWLMLSACGAMFLATVLAIVFYPSKDETRWAMLPLAGAIAVSGTLFVDFLLMVHVLGRLGGLERKRCRLAGPTAGNIRSAEGESSDVVFKNLEGGSAWFG